MILRLPHRCGVAFVGKGFEQTKIFRLPVKFCVLLLLKEKIVYRLK
jgi:hypothetical protein